MEIPLFDNGDRPPQPREEIRIEALRATPYPDRFRIFLEVAVTPFLERPNLLLVVRDTEGALIGELSIIETMHANMEFTMHIRNREDPAGNYEAEAILFYETRNPPQDRETAAFTIPAADESNE
jgi:hypothetical protein